MAHKRRGAFKGHCALCAIGRKWRRGRRVWSRAEQKLFGRRRRIRRHTWPQEEDGQ